MRDNWITDKKCFCL